jgi:hypothetical protein
MSPQNFSTPVVCLKCNWRTGELENPLRLGTSPPAILAGGTDLAPYRFGATGAPIAHSKENAGPDLCGRPARQVNGITFQREGRGN